MNKKYNMNKSINKLLCFTTTVFYVLQLINKLSFKCVHCDDSYLVFCGKDSEYMFYKNNLELFIEHICVNKPDQIKNLYKNCKKEKPLVKMCWSIYSVLLEEMEIDISLYHDFITWENICNFAKIFDLNAEKINDEKNVIAIRGFALRFVYEMKQPLNIQDLIYQKITKKHQYREKMYIESALKKNDEDYSNVSNNNSEHKLVEWDINDFATMKHELKSHLLISKKNRKTPKLIFLCVQAGTVLYQLYNNFEKGMYDVKQIILDTVNVPLLSKTDEVDVLSSFEVNVKYLPDFSENTIWITKSITTHYNFKFGVVATGLLIENIEIIFNDAVWSCLEGCLAENLQLEISYYPLKQKKTHYRYEVTKLLNKTPAINSTQIIEEAIQRFQSVKIKSNIFKNTNYNVKNTATNDEIQTLHICKADRLYKTNTTIKEHNGKRTKNNQLAYIKNYCDETNIYMLFSTSCYIF